MKLIHLSDLHIGKKVNEYSMLEDQKFILSQIINIVDNEEPNAVIIAGDVYDKAIPSAEAVELFDEFLVSLSKRKINVFVISGNHDSPERIAFGGRIMQESCIYMSPVYNGTITPIELVDEYGSVCVYMLPFVKPINVRKYYPDIEIVSYSDAVEAVVAALNVDTNKRNIMISHQFVTGAERTESEEISVGGLDNVEASIFEIFDYTALGHVHRAQKCKFDKIRYCGTPLKYSFSESKDKKSVTVVELKEKDNCLIKTIELVPKHDMREIKGTYDELMRRSFYMDTTYQNDYLHITLTDEEEIPDAIGKLRTIYHNIMRLDYDNVRTRKSCSIDIDDVDIKNPLELFKEFYQLQNNKSMSDTQSEYIKQLIENIWEG